MDRIDEEGVALWLITSGISPHALFFAAMLGRNPRRG